MFSPKITALDTSATTTAICVADSRDGAVVRRQRDDRPRAVLRVRTPHPLRLRLVGHEATSWLAWLHYGHEARGVPMVLLETLSRRGCWRRSAADRQERRPQVGGDHAVGLFKPVHAKSDEANRTKLLPAHRRTLKRKLLDIENETRQSLRTSRYMAGRRTQRGSFLTRIRVLIADIALPSRHGMHALRCSLVLCSSIGRWMSRRRDRRLDELCRRWSEIPGWGR